MPSVIPEPNPAPGGARRYDQHAINHAFNLFLGLQDIDLQQLTRYRPVLLQGVDSFVVSFYAYLMSHPAMAEVLKRYEANGGEIARLVKTQSQHFSNFLDGDSGDASAARLAKIGKIHYGYTIDPVWIMGAYLLYLEHLVSIINHSADIPAGDRAPLISIINKLLFRDMGQMLEGYWDSAVEALEQQRAEVAGLQAQVTSLLANLPQTLWSVDVINNRPLYVSPISHAVCEMNIEMPIPCLGWTVPEDRDLVQHAWQRAMLGVRVEVESRVQRPNGELRWFRRVFHPFADDTGRIVRIDGLMEDTTEKKLTMERLHQLATVDSLTGLHNRALFIDRLTQAIAAAARHPSRQVVLMLMDLDHFKEINDTLGHPVGDEILRKVGDRLRDAVRELDTVARLGGDEFAVLMPDERDGKRNAERVAQKLLACFTKPFRHGEDEFYLGVGIGIAVYPDDGEDVDTLMSRADVAMYTAKHTDAGYAHYDAASDKHTPERLQLSVDLRHALEQQELILYYQPKLDLKTGRIAGVEALLRWQHPQLGLLEPDQFIPIAERSGLINPITDWVIANALGQCKTWSDQGIELSVAVNVSGRSFNQAGLAQKIRNLLQQAQVAPGSLELEVTENVLMSDIERGAATLRSLSDIGVVISIDDYGTGHSSLAYLKQLPLRTLKIDKSFVLQMSHDDNDAVIARSTIDLAHNLGYRVVAEGVETQDALDLLAILGSDEVQGYYLSYPLPPEALMTWLQKSVWGIPPERSIGESV